MLEWRCVHNAAGTQASPRGSLGRDKVTRDCCMSGFVLSASFILCFHYSEVLKSVNYHYFRIDKYETNYRIQKVQMPPFEPFQRSTPLPRFCAFQIYYILCRSLNVHPRTHTHSFYVNDHTIFCILDCFFFYVKILKLVSYHCRNSSFLANICTVSVFHHMKIYNLFNHLPINGYSSLF